MPLLFTQYASVPTQTKNLTSFLTQSHFSVIAKPLIVAEFAERASLPPSVFLAQASYAVSESPSLYLLI